MPDHTPKQSEPQQPDETARQRQARQIAETVLRRRARGEALTDMQVLSAHRDLLPELEDALRALAHIEVAKRLADRGASDTQNPTQAGASPTTSTDDAKTAVDHARIPATTAITGYQIVRELGHGGQSIVFEAIQASTGRKVAIKVLRQGEFASTRDMARFDREAQVLASLQHPNIVAVIDRGVATNGACYLVTDYIAGQNLHDWLHARRDRQAADDPSAAMRLFLKIADAVNAAHLRGVVHRDIKPANILLDPADEPHIIDFGLAHLGVENDDASGQRMTLTGQFLGSLPWASPEQAEGIPDKIDTRTDVYALGVVLYQMLTGEFPYQVAGTMRDMLDIIATATPPPPSAVLAAREARDQREQSRRRGRPRSAINASLDAIVLKALSKRREDRYQTAGELARDVANYLAGKPTVAGGTPPRRVPSLAIFAAIFVPMATLFAGVAYWSHQRHPAPVTTTSSATQPVPLPPNYPALKPPPPSTPSVTDHRPPTTPAPSVSPRSAAPVDSGSRQTGVPLPTPPAKSESPAGPVKPVTLAPREPLTPDALRAWIQHIEAGGGTVQLNSSGQVSYVRLAPGLDLDTELPLMLRLQTLSSLRVPNASDAAIAGLAALPELRALQVVDESITDAAFDGVQSWPAIESIVLDGTKVTDVGIQKILSAPRITGVTIQRQPITARTLSLFESPERISISMHEVPLADASLESITRMPKLQELLITGTPITGSGLVHVTKATKLEILDLSQTAVTDSSLAPLKNNSTLRHLMLRACSGLTPATLDTIEQLPALKLLHLPIQFRDSAARLTTLLAARPGLRIQVAGRDPRDHQLMSGFQTLGSVLFIHGSSMQVETIALHGKAVGNKDLSQITKFSELRALTVTGASIRDDGMAALASSARLESLTLDGCAQLTDAALDHLARIKSLKTLTLIGQDRITSERINRLRSEKPTLTVEIKPASAGSEK